MKDKLDINLRIADVAISLNINRDEEELLREVSRQVNTAYDTYRQRFKNSTPREVLAKVTLLFARGYLSLMKQSKETERLIDDFEHEIDLLLEGDPVKTQNNE